MKHVLSQQASGACIPESRDGNKALEMASCHIQLKEQCFGRLANTIEIVESYLKAVLLVGLMTMVHMLLATSVLEVYAGDSRAAAHCSPVILLLAGIPSTRSAEDLGRVGCCSNAL